MVYGRIIHVDGRALFVQGGTHTWARQNTIHNAQYGKSIFFFFQVLTAKGLNKQWQNLPVGIFEIMQGYMKYGATFNVSFPSDENAPPLLTGCDRSRVQNSRKIYIASVQDATIYCTIIKYYGQTLYLCRGTIILVR